MAQDMITRNWNRANELLTKARTLLATFSNAEILSDTDKNDILEKIAREIIALINPD